ncbi:unnamed protein product [Dovyalis caffra]|uniref:Uncharacterized protein n=1 Tax=Dovyalis caffra TaxID=77055 RepID=A0AAV1QZW1_9ROSI|nr:unnamed protein product [Dovyalis caffra]
MKEEHRNINKRIRFFKGPLCQNIESIEGRSLFEPSVSIPKAKESSASSCSSNEKPSVSGTVVRKDRAPSPVGTLSLLKRRKKKMEALAWEGDLKPYDCFVQSLTELFAQFYLDLIRFSVEEINVKRTSLRTTGAEKPIRNHVANDQHGIELNHGSRPDQLDLEGDMNDMTGEQVQGAARIALWVNPR